MCVCVCVCVCVCSRVWERETRSHNRGLCANTYELHYCVCHATLFLSRAWTDGKTKDIINNLHFSFESWSSRLWKGELHFQRGLWCSAITMLWVSWPIRAVCACWKEGLCSLREAGHRGPTIMYSIWIFFWTLKHANIFFYTKYTT